MQTDSERDTVKAKASDREGKRTASTACSSPSKTRQNLSTGSKRRQAGDTRKGRACKTSPQGNLY
jgi:hypothetical protein